MSRCHFNYDFFADGRFDVLAEIRALQSCGQWTQEKRAKFLKQAVSTYQRLKRDPQSVYQGVSYNAGRVSALKSQMTARFSNETSESRDPRCGTVVYRPLKPFDHRECSRVSCREEAIWGVSIYGNPRHLLILCNRCRQERMREQTYTTPDGWDWDDHDELLPPLPIPHHLGEKLVVRKPMQASSIFFPTTVVIGLGLLDLSLGMPLYVYIITSLLLLPLTVKGSNFMLRFFTDFFEDHDNEKS